MSVPGAGVAVVAIASVPLTQVSRPAPARPTYRRPRRWTGLLLIVLVALTGCSGGGTGSGVEEGFVSGDRTITQVAPEEREPAPQVSGATVGDDAEISLADYGDKVVVLNVWASWCAPCRSETPDLVEAAAETADVAQFVGLNAKEDNPAAEEAFLRAFEVSYPSLDDPSGELQLRFAENLPPAAIPSTLVIDREGRVAARVLGPISGPTLVDLVTDVAEGR